MTIRSTIPLSKAQANRRNNATKRKMGLLIKRAANKAKAEKVFSIGGTL